MGAAGSLGGCAKSAPVGSTPTASTLHSKRGNINMPDDESFNKSEFTQVIRKLLTTKPLPKKELKTSKHTKSKTVIPGGLARPKPLNCSSGCPAQASLGRGCSVVTETFAPGN